MTQTSRWSSRGSARSATKDVRIFLRILLVLALIASAGICFLLGRNGVKTDVYAMLGGRTALSTLAEATSSQFRVLCDTPADAAKCRAVARFDDPVDPKTLYELVRTKGAGLLSEKHRSLLAAGETNKIARSTFRRDYAGVGLFSKEDDPYYFLNDFVMDLKAFQPKLKEGQELLTGSVLNLERGAIPALIALARENPGIHLSGAPFHTHLATESTKKEVNILGSISLLAVFLIGWWLFRGFRFVLPLVLTLSAGFLVGSAALFLMPGCPHILTFLFGTTLIGLGVDYCYHGLSREEGLFLRNLSAALVTTVIAFVPLLFSSVEILNEMAVFTISGLVTIYLCVISC